MRGLHTIIRNKDTNRADFVFYSDRLIRLLIEEGIVSFFFSFFFFFFSFFFFFFFFFFLFFSFFSFFFLFFLFLSLSLFGQSYTRIFLSLCEYGKLLCQEYRFVLFCLRFFPFSFNQCGPKIFFIFYFFLSFLSLSFFLFLSLSFSFFFSLYSANPIPVFFFLCVSMGSYCAKSIGLCCFVCDFFLSLSINVALRSFFFFLSFFLFFFFLSFFLLSFPSPFLYSANPIPVFAFFV